MAYVQYIYIKYVDVDRTGRLGVVVKGCEALRTTTLQFQL